MLHNPEHTSTTHDCEVWLEAHTSGDGRSGAEQGLGNELVDKVQASRELGFFCFLTSIPVRRTQESTQTENCPHVGRPLTSFPHTERHTPRPLAMPYEGQTLAELVETILHTGVTIFVKTHLVAWGLD